MSTPLDIDVTEPAHYEHGLPHDLFARLRREAPVCWNPQPPERGGFADEGFWAVSTHDLVREVSRDGQTYSSWANTAMIRYADDVPRAFVEANRALLLNKDAPEHTRLRSIVSRGFTPRAVAGLRDGLAQRVSALVEQVRAEGGGDFVQQVASEVPVQAIADLIGVPTEDRGRIVDWSTTMTGRDDPDVPGDPNTAMGEVFGYASTLAAQRRDCPADDIVTKLVQAMDADGALSDEELGYFVVLLMVAGSETTRDAISHGLLAFRDHPEQWELFRSDRPETAADEIIRWASPVMSFQRTATVDTELGGTAISAGDRLVMLYASANYDESVFADPLTFDVTRSPNPHLGFGGTGPHYCLGTSLARLEIDLVFGALADQVPDISVLGEPRRSRSGWLNSIKSMPVEYGACPVGG